MMTSQTIKDFESFAEDIKRLENIPEEIWLTPLAQGKWTLKEMVCHLWHWDKYNLDFMVPSMKNGAILPDFANIERHNQQAMEKAKEFEDGKAVLQAFLETREAFIQAVQAIYDPEMRFTIGKGKRKYSIDSFLKIFVHHDEHHKKQISLLFPNERWSTREGKSTDEKQPTFIVEEEIRVVGLAIQTTNANEMSEKARIPKLWEQFWKLELLERLSERVESPAIYSVYFDYENGAEGEYSVLVGYRVIDSEEDTGRNVETSKETDIHTVVIPPAKYAVFTTNRGPVHKVISEAWQSIWKWSETTDLERTFTGDFELYDERSIDPEDTQIDIYIAVK